MFGTSSLYSATRAKPGVPEGDKPGRLPERPMGADCKSVGESLHRFESCTCHTDQAPFRGGLTCFRGPKLSRIVTGAGQLCVFDCDAGWGERSTGRADLLPNDV